MYTIKSYILIGLSITTLCFVVLLFYMMETGESRELYTNGSGYVLLKNKSNATNSQANDVRAIPIGTVTIDSKAHPVAMLSRIDKKVNFSKTKCLKDIQRKFVQIDVLGSYPLDAGLDMLNKNPDLLENFGKQWGRPIPDTVLDLFRAFIPDFKKWATAPASKRPEPPNNVIFGKHEVSFGTLSQNTYLYFLPFKHGGSLGPVKYTGKMEPALFVNYDRHRWILPYSCGNGPAEIILPCDDSPKAVTSPGNNAMAENGREFAANNASRKATSLSKTYTEKNTESVGNNSSTITPEPSIWIPDTNGGGSSGNSSNTPSPDDDSPTNILPDSPPPESLPEPEVTPIPIVININPDTDDNIPPIPEPATWLTMTLGLLFLTIRKKNRK
ncbi:MAG: PEP-CTERM sorting domain-containing protein [Desulfobacterium sp.]